MEITAEWSGRYPNKCSGSWTIKIDSVVMPLPYDVQRGNMGTSGSYDTWSFGDDWNEEWDSYEDGAEFETWVKLNVRWIKEGFDSLKVSDKVALEDVRKLYDAIQEKDWRHNSCGGCI
jgi:DNA modification methylase